MVADKGQLRIMIRDELERRKIKHNWPQVEKFVERVWPLESHDSLAGLVSEFLMLSLAQQV